MTWSYIIYSIVDADQRNNWEIPIALVIDCTIATAGPEFWPHVLMLDDTVSTSIEIKFRKREVYGKFDGIDEARKKRQLIAEEALPVKFPWYNVVFFSCTPHLE